jgi:hypothetical protein
MRKNLVIFVFGLLVTLFLVGINYRGVMSEMHLSNIDVFQNVYFQSDTVDLVVNDGVEITIETDDNLDQLIRSFDSLKKVREFSCDCDDDLTITLSEDYFLEVFFDNKIIRVTFEDESRSYDLTDTDIIKTYINHLVLKD